MKHTTLYREIEATYHIDIEDVEEWLSKASDEEKRLLFKEGPIIVSESLADNCKEEILNKLRERLDLSKLIEIEMAYL